MAKNKKKKEADVQDDVAKDQKDFEGGAGVDTTTAQHEEEYEETQSLPGKQNDRPADEGRKLRNQEEVREAAAESAGVPMKQRLNDIGAQAMRAAKQKSQAPPAAKVKRKEPSKASARGAAKSRKPMKKKAVGPKAKAKGKAKSKSR